MKNIESTSIGNLANLKIDTIKQNPDIDKLLWVQEAKSKMIPQEKKDFYTADIEFKEESSKCMVFFENLEGRDLTMCNAYLNDALWGVDLIT